MDQRPAKGVERPRVEPEIIPPDAGARWHGAYDSRGSHRIYVGRVGPFGVAMLALAIAFLAGLALLLVLGAFVILLPFAGVLLAAAILVHLLRRFLWRS